MRLTVHNPFLPAATFCRPCQCYLCRSAAAVGDGSGAGEGCGQASRKQALRRRLLAVNHMHLWLHRQAEARESTGLLTCLLTACFGDPLVLKWAAD